MSIFRTQQDEITFHTEPDYYQHDWMIHAYKGDELVAIAQPGDDCVPKEVVRGAGQLMSRTEADTIKIAFRKTVWKLELSKDDEKDIPLFRYVSGSESYEQGLYQTGEHASGDKEDWDVLTRK